MTTFLHTMVRITDPEKSRAFYEALGLEFRRESPIVRNGETEATLYFYGVPGEEVELELTFNHDGSTYDVGTGYGHRHDAAWACRQSSWWRATTISTTPMEGRRRTSRPQSAPSCHARSAIGWRCM